MYLASLILTYINMAVHRILKQFTERDLEFYSFNLIFKNNIHGQYPIYIYSG
jgi:hypothetical protein